MISGIQLSIGTYLPWIRGDYCAYDFFASWDPTTLRTTLFSVLILFSIQPHAAFPFDRYCPHVEWVNDKYSDFAYLTRSYTDNGLWICIEIPISLEDWASTLSFLCLQTEWCIDGHRNCIWIQALVAPQVGLTWESYLLLLRFILFLYKLNKVKLVFEGLSMR